MPAVPRTTTEAVVVAARELIERDGLQALTMQAVAERVGVRAPSLYKRVAGREGLVALVTEQVAEDLATEIDEAMTDTDPAADLRALATVFHDFARRNPATYPLLFAPSQSLVSDETRDRTSAAVRRVSGRLAGPDLELAAARMVTAWAHGFVTMEQAGAFQLGGDLEEAWDFALDRLVVALRGD